MRPSSHDTFMEIAYVLAKRTTCLRRGVGCVLINDKKHIIGTGYNGSGAGEPHCNEMKLAGVNYKPWGDPRLKLTKPREMVETYPNACSAAQAPSGTDLDNCLALHAEWNALLQCRHVQEIEAAYVTLSPCLVCAKLFLNTSCKRLYYAEEYHNIDEVRARWQRSGRQLIHHPYEVK